MLSLKRYPIKINENNPKNISKRKISNKATKNKLNWNLKFNLEKGLNNLLTYKNQINKK